MIPGETLNKDVAKKWGWRIPENYNIGYDVVDKHVAVGKKNKVILYWENSHGVEKKFTLGEMKQLTNKFGNALKKIGVKKGDRFLMRLPNIPEFHISFLGGVKIGAVPIPSSVMFKADEIEYRINDSGAVAVIVAPRFLGEVEQIKDKCPTLKTIILVGDDSHVSYEAIVKEASSNLKIEDTKSRDVAFFCYTSGTTGPPKGAVHLHQWVMGNDPSVLFWQSAKDDDLIAHTGDLNWIFPLGNGFLYPWRWGISTFIYDGRFDPVKWYEFIEKYKITNLASVPTAYRMLLTVKDAEKTYNLSSLRHCISAGEPLNPEVVKEWRRRTGLDAYDGIGMTEIMVYLSNMKGIPIRPGSCGQPQPGHHCAIVDGKGKELSANQPGILAVKEDDPGLFKEYWGKPDKTSECFRNGYFLTGDVLYRDNDGYYWFSGRNDDLINASGYRISPFEVESAVISHPAVLETAAVESPDKMRGSIVKAFVVLHKGEKPSLDLKKDIQEHVKRVSAPYKYPREIEFVAMLPKTQSGKIKRKELRQGEYKKN